ncbi:hypothetical protein [Endozoicomonas arenosclerae]|uniref:hypothetical protein n=1 Tax=Endozoicomonas arenosclerae TaxID=1633495 RepID=UPI0007864166|nr:hypothetical protein [Endozoicomonas arenosclerae]
MRSLARTFYCLSLTAFTALAHATPAPEDDILDSLNWCPLAEVSNTVSVFISSDSNNRGFTTLGRFKSPTDSQDEYSLAFSPGNRWIPAASLYRDDIHCLESPCNYDNFRFRVDPYYLKDGVDLQVLCDNDDIVHRFIEINDDLPIPAINLPTINQSQQHLCLTSYGTGLGFTDNDECTLFALEKQSYSSQSVLTTPFYYLIATPRVTWFESQDAHRSKVHTWSKPTKPLSEIKTFSSGGVPLHVSYCKHYARDSSGRITPRIGVELIQDSDSAFANSRCHFISERSTTTQPPAIAFTLYDEMLGYERVVLDVTSDWTPVTQYREEARAGCLLIDGQSRCYNFCRVQNEDEIGGDLDHPRYEYLYGYLLEGSNQCKVIGIAFNHKGDKSYSQAASANKMEIYTAGASLSSSANITSASIILVVATFIGILVSL